MVVGHFEIKENNLRLDERGMVRGRILYRFARTRADQPPESYDFICTITNLDQPELLKLEPGQKFRMRYRLYDVGPFPKQNVYAKFLTDGLKFRKEDIVGHAQMAAWTEVVVDGAN